MVAVGGDGTVHEVANGLVGGRAMLGVVPLGSGNDFFKMLRSPRDIEQAVAYFAEARVRECDVGRVRIDHADGRSEQTHFINGLGLGLEAAVADTARKSRWIKGFPRYLVAALWHVANYSPPRMHVRCREFELDARQFLIAVGNGCCAGGRFRLTPHASIDDGRLDVCRVETRSRLRLLRILPSVFSGSHGRFREVSLTQTRGLHIDCPEGCMVHADGEILAREAVELDVEVLPGRLRLLG